MELEHMREFLVLSELCNYNEAAEQLFLSQSALFKHIKSLEAEIGSPLFNKIGKRIVISEYGQLFIPYAKESLKNHDMFMQEVESRRSEMANLVLIGTQYRITDLITAFRRTDDRYMLHIIEGGDVEDFLYKNNCELAFIRNLEDPEGKYVSVPYTQDRMAVVLYPSHPLASRDKIQLDELKRENFVSFSRGSEDRIVSLCSDAGFKPRIVLTARPGNEIARMVSQCVGISILNKNVITSVLQDNVVLVDLDPPVLYDISLVYRKDVTLSPAAKAFVTYVTDLNKGEN